MIEIKNLSIRTHKQRSIVENLSLVINENDKLAIIGEEGNGKSTIIKAIYNKELVSDYVNVTGEVEVHNKKIGYLPQFLDNVWSYNTVQEYLLKVTYDEEVDYNRYELLYNVIRDLSKSNINLDILDSDQKLNTLSGGEKVKIQLVKILMDIPDILLLDEPTNDIDLNTLEWLENFINTNEIPIIFISHDETLLENCSNRILHLEQLKKKSTSKWTLENTGYKDYYNNRSKSLIHQQQVAMSERRAYKKQMERFRQIYQRVEHEQNVISRSDPSGARLLAKKIKSLKSLENRIENQEFTEVPEVEEAIVMFFEDSTYIPNGKRVLDFTLDELSLDGKKLSKNIDLKIYGPKKVTIVGENGVGKTTLLKKILNQLNENDSIKVGYFPQYYKECMDFEKNAIEFLSDCFQYEENYVATVRSYLGSVKFTREEMVTKLSNLSGGQLGKLYLLKLILQKANVLVLDEPTRNFSPLSNPVFRQILINFKGTIICVTHDRKYIDEVSDVVYELTRSSLKIKCGNR